MPASITSALLHVLVVEMPRQTDPEVELQLVQAVLEQVVDEGDHGHHPRVVPGVLVEPGPTAADQRTAAQRVLAR